MTEKQKYPWQEERNAEIFKQLVEEFMRTVGIPSNMINLYIEIIEFEWKEKLKIEKMRRTDIGQAILEHIGAIDLVSYHDYVAPQNRRIKLIREAMQGTDLGRAEITAINENNKIESESVPIISLHHFMSLIADTSDI